MNIQQYKTPAILFASGGAFFYFEHFHRAILEHGYHVGLVAAGVGLACAINSHARRSSEAQKSNEVHNHTPRQNYAALEANAEAQDVHVLDITARKVKV